MKKLRFITYSHIELEFFYTSEREDELNGYGGWAKSVIVQDELFLDDKWGRALMVMTIVSNTLNLETIPDGGFVGPIKQIF